MKLSRVSKNIPGSPVRELYEKAKSYSDTIDFTLGDPDFYTSRKICEAVNDAINSRRMNYSSNAGLMKLRERISDFIAREDGMSYDPASEIMVTVGAMEALYTSLVNLLDPGDEVIVFSPYWSNYIHMIQMCGGEAVIVNTEEDTFDIDVDKMKAAITPRTVAVIINHPNNPTGTVYSEAGLRYVLQLSEQYGLAVICDQCYRSLVYPEAEYHSIPSLYARKENLILIDSLSKRFAMTGWRLGYVAAPAQFIAGMVHLQENMVACAALPSQYAAIAALSTALSDEVRGMLREYKMRRDYVVSQIANIPKLRCNLPQATFYIWVNIKATGLSGKEFAGRLLEQEHVAVVPGIAYGDDRYIRVALTMGMEKIKEGMVRIRRFLD